MTKPLKVGEKVRIISDEDVNENYLPMIGYYLGSTGSDYWICSDPDYDFGQFDDDPVFPNYRGGFFMLNYSESVYNQTPSGQRKVIRAEKILKGLVKFLRKVEEQYV
jgi:hypothetical protein